MTIRISSANRFDSTIASMQQRQSDLTQAQLQLSSGKRITQPSDDPTGAARAERAYVAQQRIDGLQRSVATSRSAMSLAEAALGSANDILQSSRETLIAAGNGGYGPGERAALVSQLQQFRSQLLSVANQTDGAGGYIFGGQGTTGEPFVDAVGGVSFAGTAGQAGLSAVEQIPTTVDGQAIWLNARTGNGVFQSAAAASNTGKGWIDAGGVSNPAALTGSRYDIVFSVSAGSTTYSVLKDGAPTAVAGAAYRSGSAITIDGQSLHISGQPADTDRFSLTPSTPTQDPFTALTNAIASLGNPSANSGQLSQAMSNGLRDIDAVMSQVQTARSQSGAALTRLDQMEQRNRDKSLWAKTVQSNAEDVDMVQAVSEFQGKQTSYSAALQSYALVQRMSLFDYLK